MIDYPKNACLNFALGRLEKLLGSDAAAQHFETAAEIYSQSAMASGEVYSRLGLSDSLSEAGEREAALIQVELAEAAARRFENTYLTAEVLVRRARLWIKEGARLERVESALREVDGLVLPEGHSSLQRDTLLSLGEVLHQLGRFDEAEACYRRAIEVTQRKNRHGKADAYGEAAAWQNLAMVSAARPPEPPSIRRTITLFQKALDLAANAGQRGAESDVRRWLGRLVGGEEGRREIERSIAIAREIDDQFQLRLGLSALGAELVETDLMESRERMEQARALALEAGAPDLPIYGWADRLKVVWASAAPSEAIAESLEELETIEKVRQLQTDSLTRARIFSVWADAYSWLAGRLLETRPAASDADLDLAFELLERRHARVLLESAGAQSGSDREFARLVEVRTALAENEAMLFFQQAYERDIFGDFAGGSWLLVITRGGMRVIPTLEPLKVDPMMPTFVSLFARRDGTEAEAAAWTLEIGGLVEHPLKISLSDIKALPQRTMRVTLECAGNGRAGFHPPTSGNQWDARRG
ncbi:MAG: molybdopterin-dependent oxidoreductase, partial [Thermoanaerobaculia bacterium]|nr:molybdopterin-dependent oxidoreductase [Thermoanaerobaculia bacterium]